MLECKEFHCKLWRYIVIFFIYQKNNFGFSLVKQNTIKSNSDEEEKKINCKCF